MSNLKKTLGEFLQESRILIGNSQALPEISGPLAGFGYDAPRWAEGNKLLEAAEALTLAQKKEYGDQYQATEAVQDAWAVADEAYTKTLKIARLVFANDVHASAALRLSGMRKNSLAGWLDQARFFYGNLVDPALMAQMGRYGYTPEKVQTEKALVEALQVRVLAQGRETAEAQRATVNRDEAVKQLDQWVGELRAVLQVALGNSETLEAVGITVPAPRTKKKSVSY